MRLVLLLGAVACASSDAPDQREETPEATSGDERLSSSPIERFNAGYYNQCEMRRDEAAACRAGGEPGHCEPVALRENPCAGSGALCTPERMQTHSTTFPACVCTCSDEFRAWRQELDERYRQRCGGQPCPPPP